jgi:hypothetical protein
MYFLFYGRFSKPFSFGNTTLKNKKIKMLTNMKITMVTMDARTGRVGFSSTLLVIIFKYFLFKNILKKYFFIF